MSLSMQMTRGAVAVSLLVLLGMLALASAPPADKRAGVLPITTVSANATPVCEAPVARTSGWMLAQTPADLGPLARRWESCRA